MDQQTRNLLQNATQRARRLLETEIAEQLGGTFDILRDGTLADKPGTHLTPDQALVRGRLVDSVRHRAGGSLLKEKLADAVGDYTREVAFTILNRFVALKMLEARSLVQQCISKGDQSSGFKEFSLLAPALATFPDKGYRLYLECVFDELSVEVKILFDRHDAASLIWPRRQNLDDLLSILNDADLAEVWGVDETIGWVYQYFNSQADRDKARYDSAGKPKAPQDSYELAVRNQFFTPRYVVQFLTDNTLGRTWYEMRQGETQLTAQCEYMVRRPTEIFLAVGQPAPEEPKDPPDLSQEEVLQQPVHIPHRAKKDPRDLKILDPALGSGHFLLYCFDLLLTIYEEAWHDHTSPPSLITGATLRQNYPTQAALRHAIPSLILSHNLHGIDIDPRCAQIAALALWMRAQRAFADFKLSRNVRPAIRKTNIVVAEPMPGEPDLFEEFLRELNADRLESLIHSALKLPKDRQVRATRAMADSLCDLVRTVWEKMKLAGQLGSLLRIEYDLTAAISEGREEWEERLPLFRVTQYSLDEPARTSYARIVPGDEADFWTRAETLVLKALESFGHRVETDGTRAFRRGLFADDAARGLALVDLVRQAFDIVLMNPPFGAGSSKAKTAFEQTYPRTKNDLFAAFVERGLHLLQPGGLLGAITSRTGFFLSSFQKWREEILLQEAVPALVADLGIGVMDAALVEAAAYCLSRSPTRPGMTTMFLRTLEELKSKDAALRSAISDPLAASGKMVFIVAPERFRLIPTSPFAYWVSERLRSLFANLPLLEANGRVAKVGLQTSDDFRFLRLWWAVPASEINKRWFLFAKGGVFSPFYCDVYLAVNWEGGGREVRGFDKSFLRNTDCFFRPGLTWPRRTKSELSLRALPSNCAFADKGPSVFVPQDRGELLLALLAICRSLAYRSLVDFQLAAADAKAGGAARSYDVGVLQRTPIPELDPVVAIRLATLSRRAWSLKRALDTCVETSHAFCLPAILTFEQSSLARRATAWCGAVADVARRLSEIQESIDAESFSLYAISEGDRRAITDGFGASPDGVDNHEQDSDDDEEAVEAEVHPGDALGATIGLVCWSVGVAFGRFDVRLAIGERPIPPEPEPFAALPVYSPGMLTGDDGVPAVAPPPRYPIAVHQAGMLVDDPGHTLDLIAAVRGVFDVVFADKADPFWQETAEFLDPRGRDIRTWFAKSFFEIHLKRYSKSRRKAPIYWQLSTASASYAVWLYVHRVSGDTLFRVQQLVEEKVEHEQRNLAGLQNAAGSNPTAGQRKEIEAAEGIGAELATFLDEVKRVAPLWKPDLDDGVVLVLALLWRLFPQHRAWQSELKSRWDDLCEGKYDWAHVAMHLWPERVVPKCQIDRSLAIAHGLEHVFWVDTHSDAEVKAEAETPIEAGLVKEDDMYGDDGEGKPKKRTRRAGGRQRWVARPVEKRQMADLIAERTHSGVKAALKSLLDAPTPGGEASKVRKKGTRVSQ